MTGAGIVAAGLASPPAHGVESPDAPAEYAVLHVGVHQGAGTLYDIAADGAAGQCEVYMSRVACPATGSVTFRWGPGEASGWALTGADVVAPGSVGVAFVLADDASRQAERERLTTEAVTPDAVRDLFIETSDNPVPAPSRGMLDDLFALTEHADPIVRRQTIDALVAWWRHTASDPLTSDAPQIVPPGLLWTLAKDRDKAVRRRLANRLRDVNMPGEPLQAEAQEVLQYLATLPGAQRPAMASLGILSKAGRANAEESWIAAMERVVTPGPKGRAAANALAKLASVLEPSDLVEPDRAIALVLQHQRERTWVVWFAWREALPFDGPRFSILLRDTLGSHAGLVRHFADTSPTELAATLHAWEPLPPHSPRWELVTQPLQGHEHPAIQALFTDDEAED